MIVADMEPSEPTTHTVSSAPTRQSAASQAFLRRAWEARDVALALPALLLAGAGEMLLLEERPRAWGAALLAVSVLLGAVAWSGTRAVPSPVAEPHEEGAGTGRRELALRLGGIAAALFLSGGGMLAWLAEPGAVFGLQGVLWLASIAVFALSCYHWQPGLGHPARAASPSAPWTRHERLLFGGLTALALCTYLLGLDAIPWSFHQDEVVAYAEALRFYEGSPISLFTTTWFGTSLPSLPFAFTGNLMHLVGAGMGGARAGVALVGALALLPTYGLARLLWGRVAAAVAGLAWATSPVALHYSRISIVNITTATCWAACFYFLLHGLRTHRPMSFALSGLAGGLSMYTFYGTRLLPYLLVAFAAYLALFHFRTFRAHLGNLGLVVVGFIVGFGPLAAYFVRHPDMWAGRGLSKLNVPPAIPTSWEALAHDWNVLAPLADRNLLSLSVLPGNDGFYWAPFFSPVEAVLLLLGVGVIASRWRQPGAFLVLLWGTGVVVVGGTLIDRDHIPAFVHWTPAFPAFFIALSLPVSLLIKTLVRYSPRWRYAGVGLLAAGLCVLAGANLYHYVAVYPSLVPPAFAPAEGRFLATLSPGSLVRVVGNSSPPYSPEMGRMLAPRLAVGEMLNPSLELPLPSGPGRDLV
ncbi:MAG TPA: glycosyltransferase family 39 protein, partial [Chloroflexia bacterium]|nr:glycosyltransferase family 39 protein [Chloroflexia bacterium]